MLDVGLAGAQVPSGKICRSVNSIHGSLTGEGRDRPKTGRGPRRMLKKYSGPRAGGSPDQK